LIENHLLDNAATSWPKPEAVYEAVDHAMRYSGNASRSGHRLALEADRLLYQLGNCWLHFQFAGPSTGCVHEELHRSSECGTKGFA